MAGCEGPTVEETTVSIVIYFPDRQGSGFWLSRLPGNRRIHEQRDENAVDVVIEPGGDGVVIMTPREPLSDDDSYAVVYTGTLDAWCFEVE